MLRREDALRLSESTQAAFRSYRDAGRGPEGMLAVPTAVQLRVAEEFGVPPDVGLEALRCAPALLPGDDEVPTLSLYRRHNRCVDGSLNVGDLAPDVELFPVCGSARASCGLFSPSRGLHSLLAGCARGLILIAGSYT